jgi:tetratricopeptide (TPR) repeat protein
MWNDDLSRAFEELIEERHSGTGAKTAAEGAKRAGSGGSVEGRFPATGLEEPCPAREEWTLLLGRAAGVEDRPRVDALLAHAALCPACAGQLRILSDDATEEEAAELLSLPTATPEWQSNLVAWLSRSPHRAAPRSASRGYLWAGSALAASLLLTGIFGMWWRTANSPEHLLAEAYTRTRIFDLRIPGAGFGEVVAETHLRGGSTGRESAPLLDAKAQIERHLESAPQDPHWLALEARADLLEEKFDPAIDILDRLLAAGPVTPSLLTDDAAAYFERGAASGSENDRATALEYLRRADELAPGDPVVLFNEAVSMEDRGQMMNAVETWNRYLRFENDPKWAAEGRRRLQALEEKLNRLKTHQSRMDQHLATPAAMRALAADPVTLAQVDEELSSTMLQRLLEQAFPITADHSRGSPCEESCSAARTLLYALASSLEKNHQDPWLTDLLPASLSPPDLKFMTAAHALAEAIGSDVLGEYPAAKKSATEAERLFQALHNPAGEDRAAVELSYALMRSSDVSGCYGAAHRLLGRNPQFVWTQIRALTQDTLCDSAPGRSGENHPAYLRAIDQAQAHNYTLLILLARNLFGAPAADSGDSENAWRIYLPTIRKFYAGDYPPQRLYAALSALAEVEAASPRVQEALLVQREVVGVIELTPGRNLIPTERFNLATAAIRAGAVPEAQQQIGLAQKELQAQGGGDSVKGFLAESEIAMANLYLERRDLGEAEKALDAARDHIAGEDNSGHARMYALARGEFELAKGQLEPAESLLRETLLDEERMAGKGGPEAIVLAKQDRDLYATLAGVWLAQGRGGDEVLALWERYRLRVLGEPVPRCAGKALDCLKPRLAGELPRLGSDIVLGQVVLLDRLLLYKVSAGGVSWSQVPLRRADVLAAAEPLERAVSSAETPMEEVDRAALRAGSVLLAPLETQGGSPSANGNLRIESDPLLGNLPWPSVATKEGPIGLRFNLEESPSILLAGRADGRSTSAAPTGKPLIVGASIASGEEQALPEALNEAKAVARFGSGSDLLLAGQATEPQLADRLRTASAIHFAGHATQMNGATRLLLAPGGLGSDGMDLPYLDSEMLRLHPPRSARLAVFSACSTGKKEEGWNHGMGDIVSTLVSLGVPDVVATRWQIDSASAVPMMDGFYAGLAKGETVPRALTAARQNLIRDPRYRHPYYWAAWYASGSGSSDLNQIFHGN